MSSGGGKNLLRVRSEFDDNVSGPLDKLRDKFDTVGKSKGAQSILMGVGMSAGVAAFGMLDNAISGVVDIAGDAIRDASDLNETLSKSSVIFGDNAGEVEAWGKTMATAGGQSQKAALDAASGFAGLFQTVGIAADESAGMAKSLTQMGSDLASFFNTDVETALLSLKSGLSGESEPLRKFNVFLSETAVAAKLAEMGIKKVGGQFTESEKATARYALIMEQTGAAQGDFARTGDGLANASRSLQAEIDNLSAELGQDLLPIMRDLAIWARDDGVPALRELITTVKDNADTLSTLGQVLGFLVGQGPSFRSEWEKQTKALEDQAKAEEEAVKWGAEMSAKLAGVSAMQEGVTATAGPAAAGIDDVGDESKETGKQLDGMRDALDKASQAFLDATFGPEQLKIELGLARADAILAENALDALLDPAGKPVKGATWRQINEAKLEVSESKERVSELAIKLAGMGEMSFPTLIAQLGKVDTKLDLANDEAWDLVNALGKVGVLTGGAPSIPRGRSGPRASGGPVSPGGTYTVGERGTETLVMGRTGGYVIPHGVTPAGASSGGTLNVNVTVAGGIIDPNGSAAQEIARQLVYALKREVNRQGISLIPS